MNHVLDQVSRVTGTHLETAPLVVLGYEMVHDLWPEFHLMLATDELEDLKKLLEGRVLCHHLVGNPPEKRFVSKLSWLEVRGEYDQDIEWDLELTAGLQGKEIHARFERDDPFLAARQSAQQESETALQAEIARVQQEHDERLAAELDRAKRDAEKNEAELMTASEQQTERVHEQTRTETLATAKAEAENALRAELVRLQADSDAQLSEEIAQVRREADEALAAQIATAGAEADRARAEATQEAREAAEAAAERSLHTEIARVQAETEKALASVLVKLRREEEERRRTELADITAQVAQLKDAAAEQAKTAAAEALQSELERIRRTTVVEERVIRLAPPPVEAHAPSAPRPASVTTTDTVETPDVPDADDAPAKDYYSLWQTDETPGLETVTDTAARPKRDARQAVVGIAAAACLVAVVMFGAGAADDIQIGYILVDGPPGAQVWVEGTLIGETPLPEISAQIGEREVVVIHPEAGEIRQTVLVDAESPTVLTLGPTEPVS